MALNVKDVEAKVKTIVTDLQEVVTDVAPLEALLPANVKQILTVAQETLAIAAKILADV